MVEHGVLLAPKGFFVFRFTTNGSLLDDTIIKFAFDNDICFNVSFDGLHSTHDKNRVLLDGSGTSELIIDKFNLIPDKGKMGIVSTYAANTIHEIVDGTSFLMEEGFGHVSFGLCMGESDKYKPDELSNYLSGALDIYTSKYNDNNFNCRNVVLDKVLESLVDEHLGYQTEKQPECIWPYKVSFDGKIYSCDRVPNDMNLKIACVNDNEVEYEHFANNHFCINKKPEICKDCDISKYCAPCVVYAGNYYNNLLSNNEFAYCMLMKIIVTKAVELFDKKKDDLFFNTAFSSRLRADISNGNFDVI